MRLEGKHSKININSNLKKIFFYLMLLMLSLLFGVSRDAFCQNSGFKYFKNYTTKEYDRQPQNWCIIQDKRGIIYVGNMGGLLEFDGVSWRKIDIPNRTVRSMALDENGTVYIGGVGEFGFLEPDVKGALKYKSLLEYLEDDKKNFSDVWKTYSTGEGVYFQTKEFLFRWNSKQIEIWEPNGRFYFSFTCKGKLFIRQEKKGLMQVVNDSLQPIAGGETFAKKKIFMMAPHDSGKTLIGTRSNGFFFYDGKTTKPFPTDADDYLKKNRLYHGIRLSSGDFALATLRGGLVIIGSDGGLKEIFTKASGINDDNVKYVFEDSHGNLWLCLNNGISKIEYASPVFIYDDRSNLPGLVLSVTRHRSGLYAGTSTGLYSLASTGKFQPVPGIPTNCWSLLSIGSSVLAATSSGVFQVENTNIKQRVTAKKSYVLLQSQIEPNRIWVGTHDGLVSLYLKPENAKKQWAEEYKFENITQQIRTIAEDKNGDLWLGTTAKGVLKADLSDHGKMSDCEVTEYNTSHGLPDSEINVFIAAGHVMFATENGIFRFNEEKEGFIPDSTLGDEFAGGPEGRGIFRIAEDRNKNIWFHSSLTNLRATPGSDDSFDITPTPVLRTHAVQVNAIYPDGDIVWFAGNEALIRYDTTINKNYRYYFPTLIRDVFVNGNSLVFDNQKYKHRIDSNSKSSFPAFPYIDRNFRFQFAAPLFEGESRTQYRCLLEGYNDQWSVWSLETTKDYTNLNPGRYTFRVQAKNFYEHKGREDRFQFRVLPPWYKTWLAFLCYALASFLLVVFIVKWRSGKLKREKRKLERIVKERTKEIEDKNQQLENHTLQLKEQSEKLEEMDKIKSRFFVNISHEFRTPLTLIMGPLDHMLSNTRNKEQKKNLNLMLQNSQRLLLLINQLLDLSRFDSGKMKLQAAQQNIIPFLKGITASFESLAIQNKIHLTLAADTENITLYFDPEKLEQIACNLLSNAVKFTPAGGKITVAVTKNPKKEKNFPSGFLEISVRDTGIGIPKEQLEHIFDRFYQAEGLTGDTGEYHHKGTGIGLALTKELVGLHHGRIDVHSSKEKGTAFIIGLPMGNKHLKPGEMIELSEIPSSPGKPMEISTSYLIEEAGNEVQPTDANEKNIEDKNVILVVEDNADVRKYIRAPLEPLYTVKEAVNGREGIQMAKKIIPDLIISDIMMPKADGYELCSALKKDLNTSHIPIILLTAKASEESIIQGLETGADDYITKPFNTKILCSRIKNLIDLRCQLQQKIQREMVLQPAEVSVSSIDQTFLKELQEAIEKNLSDPLFGVEQLGKKLYMSRTTLYRKVFALTGESPREFIKSYRLKRGAQLLKANFGNVTEVAFEVGFSSSPYFTKCFKEKFHQLPHTYQASNSAPGRGTL